LLFKGWLQAASKSAGDEKVIYLNLETIYDFVTTLLQN
jgi:hypothetical protein